MRLFLVSILLACVQFSWGQGPRIPEDVQLEEPSDYTDQEGLARKCLAWLINTPLDEHVEKRMEVNAFVMMWLAGHPELKLDINSDVLPFIREDDTLIFPFIHGMALYQIGHPSETDTEKLHAEGLRTLAKAVRQNSCVKKTKSIKAVLKAERKDELPELVAEWLKP